MLFCELGIFFQRFRSSILMIFSFLGLLAIPNSCYDMFPSGVFGDCPVSGVTYTTPTNAGKTDTEGTFHYKEGETITFSIGNLVLGSATGQKSITPLTLVPDAVNGAADQRVSNMLILLHTLDQDGDLNNGIQITPSITNIVSASAASINFNQTTAAFAADPNIVSLLTALNSAGVFTDTYRGARTLRKVSAALVFFARATGERTVVMTKYGALKGYESSDSTWQFLGIPYAKAPVGNLRWKSPQALNPWKGEREALEWGDKCPQDPAMIAVMGEGGVSENCLYLNVTVPKDAKNLPVMVWFHGGGFVMGSANSPMFNNAAGLPTKGVIVVTVTHRLGPFGYLAHSLLAAESGKGTGNYGQLDLIAALQWVKKNIKAFGGDPGSVTIFGQSGGGAKVISLMSSPLAKGLFHKAICQSGMGPSAAFGGMNGVDLTTAETSGAALFTGLGITTLAEARAKTATEIETSALAMGAVVNIYGPVIDNFYISAGIYESIEAGLASDVPLLTGATSGDMGAIPMGVIEQMPLRYQYCSAAQYVYRFDQAPSGWESSYPGILVGHSGDLKYIFNYPAGVIDDYFMGSALDPITHAPITIPTITGVLPVDIMLSAGLVPPNMAWSSADATVADNTMTIWTNFAKTGNPSTAGFAWPAYTIANDTFVEINAPILVRTNFSTGY